MINWRVIQQVLGMIIGLIALVIIARKIKLHPHSWREWLPLIVAIVANVIYYLFLALGLLENVAGDWSATRALVTLCMLLIYARIMPPIRFTL